MQDNSPHITNDREVWLEGTHFKLKRKIADHRQDEGLHIGEADRLPEVSGHGGNNYQLKIGKIQQHDIKLR